MCGEVVGLFLPPFIHQHLPRLSVALRTGSFYLLFFLVVLSSGDR